MATSRELLSTTDVLSQVFFDDDRIQGSNVADSHPVHVIMQGEEPRWIVIGKPSSVMPVLNSWAPWKLVSRLQWDLVKLAAATNTLSMVPGISRDAVKINIAYWQTRLAEFPNNWSLVIHIGSQSHTRKAILFVVENGKRVVCAAKIPLAPDAADAIFNEANALDRLSRFSYLPRVLFRDKARGVAVQSWLEGKPVGRGFSQAHLDILESLAHSEGTMRVCDCREELVRDIETVDLPFDRSALLRGVELLDHHSPMRKFLEHRDFAPWNLKWIEKGTLGLLDWEWAQVEGLPWQDVSRYFYIDDVHFKGSGRVWEGLLADPLLKVYRRDFEIQDDAIPSLTMHYLIRELLMEFKGGNPKLANYAFTQIQALLDAVRPVKG
jgi:hypothetical protein